MHLIHFNFAYTEKNNDFRSTMDIVKVRGFYLGTCDPGYCCPSPVCVSLFQLRVNFLGDEHKLPISNSFCCLALKREDLFPIAGALLKRII